jgi:hypothetical protein
MRDSRISTPVRKTFDSWLFRYNDKSIKFDIELRRSRDMERTPDNTPHARFVACIDRDHLKKQGIEDFPLEDHEAISLDELQAQVQKTIQDRLVAGWRKVIIVGLEKADTTYADKSAVNFLYQVGLQSTDGRMFKHETGAWVTRRVEDMLRGGFDRDQIIVCPYSEELETGLDNLKDAFDTLVDRLHDLIKSKTDTFVRIATNLPQYTLLPEDTSESE